MNTNNFNKYLESTSLLCDELPSKKFNPIVVSDSKGDYLLQEAIRGDANCIEKSIGWYTKKGTKTEEAVDWIIRNYDFLKERNGNFFLYLWTGTCDASFKQNFTNSNGNRRYWLSLHNDYKLKLNGTLRALNRLLEFAERKKFGVIILEIPVYCLQACNEYNGNRSKVNFAEQDKNLHDAIDEINAEIRILNRERISPKFNCDLRRNRINRRGRSTSNYVFTYFKDGIHPTPISQKNSCQYKVVILYLKILPMLV